MDKSRTEVSFKVRLWSEAHLIVRKLPCLFLSPEEELLPRSTVTFASLAYYLSVGRPLLEPYWVFGEHGIREELIRQITWLIASVKK